LHNSVTDSGCYSTPARIPIAGGVAASSTSRAQGSWNSSRPTPSGSVSSLIGTEGRRDVPVVLNAANEIGRSFLDGKLGFTSIPVVIDLAMNGHAAESVSTLETVRKVDSWARTYARERAGELELTT
jgi:hypothetical protein